MFKKILILCLFSFGFNVFSGNGASVAKNQKDQIKLQFVNHLASQIEKILKHYNFYNGDLTTEVYQNITESIRKLTSFKFLFNEKNEDIVFVLYEIITKQKDRTKKNHIKNITNTLKFILGL